GHPVSAGARPGARPRRLGHGDDLQAVPSGGERAGRGEDGLPAIELGPREGAVSEDCHRRCRPLAGGHHAGAAGLETFDDRLALIVREALNAAQGEHCRVGALAHLSTITRVSFSNMSSASAWNYILFILYIIYGTVRVV